MIAWAPIVFARTEQVDFRFLVVPDDFETSMSQWIERYILGSLQSSEKLHERPRWLIVKGNEHTIVGISCRASKLSSKNIEDKYKRGLYLFAGYVSNGQRQEFIPMMKPESFEQLYTFVHNRWEDSDINESRKVKHPYDIVLDNNLSSTISSQQFQFNQDQNKVKIFSFSEENNLWLWAGACHLSLSLCLGITYEKEALNSPFLNVTINNMTTEKEISRQNNLKDNFYSSIQKNIPVNKQSETEKILRKPNNTTTHQKKASPVQNIDGKGFLTELTEEVEKGVKVVFSYLRGKESQESKNKNQQQQFNRTLRRNENLSSIQDNSSQRIEREEFLTTKKEPKLPYGFKYDKDETSEQTTVDDDKLNTKIDSRDEKDEES